MKKLIRLLWPGIVALIVVLVAFALTTSAASPVRLGNPSTVRTPDVSVACGASTVPYSVYSMPLTQNESLTLNFNSTGAGLVTFVATNWQDSFSARINGNCGSCTLTIPNISPGPLGIMQLSATAAADNCPSSGLVVSNFVLTVSPSAPSN